MFLFADIRVSPVPPTILRSDIVTKEAIPRNLYCKLNLQYQDVPFALELVPPLAKFSRNKPTKRDLRHF